MLNLKPWLVIFNRSVEDGELEKYSILHLENVVGIKSEVERTFKEFTKTHRDSKYTVITFYADFEKKSGFTGFLFRDLESMELWCLKERVRALEREQWRMVDEIGGMMRYKEN